MLKSTDKHPNSYEHQIKLSNNVKNEIGMTDVTQNETDCDNANVTTLDCEIATKEDCMDSVTFESVTFDN